MPPKKKIEEKKLKAAPKKAEKIQEKIELPREVEKYIQAVGRRKTSIARVRLYPAKALSVSINEKPLEGYFSTVELRSIVKSPFERASGNSFFSVTVKVSGGGIHSQAEAVRHGISRALEKHSPDVRKILKPLGFLKRDPRMKERRKFGLKKARKAPQWAKR